jgi:superfamily II DNA helicase RecQ
MQYRAFQYPLPTDPELLELNAFLLSHRIATVRQEIVVNGGMAMLVFVVEVAGTEPSLNVSKNTAKADYREQLTSSEFIVFSQLRDLRKRIANEEGVPVYAVFTNAQLAQIVQHRMMTITQFATVEGIGKSRLEKYGDQIGAVMKDAFETQISDAKATAKP